MASLASATDWSTLLAEAIRDPAELCRVLRLPDRLAEQAQAASDGFPLQVPRPFVERMRPGDAEDPLLLQVLPQPNERESVAGFQCDPLDEIAPAAGLGLPNLLSKYTVLSKYAGRSLIVTSRDCGVHCRFCFRRHFRRDIDQGPPATPTDDWEPICRRLAADRSLHEVILSGGDPLTLPDMHLARITYSLEKIPHLRRLRIHTRLPIVIPQRVTDALLSWIRGTRLTPIVVIHVNHPAEIDDSVAQALTRLADAGVPLLSQTVLLRAINDDADVLAQLCERLVGLRVMPYYLHQLDRVAGAAHFEVPESTGRQLIAQLRARLPGYAVPRYVRETPGRPGKDVLA